MYTVHFKFTGPIKRVFKYQEPISLKICHCQWHLKEEKKTNFIFKAEFLNGVFADIIILNTPKSENCTRFFKFLIKKNNSYFTN